MVLSREVMRIVKVVGYTARLLLVVAIALALVGFLPATATAQAKPLRRTSRPWPRVLTNEKSRAFLAKKLNG